MIHSARQTGKFIKLVRFIRSSFPSLPINHETVAVGILESLWHFTLSSHKRGDIGRSDNEVIAEAIGWHGDADQIIDALVDCRWLDRCDQHRLVVHDWADHAPAHIKKNAERLGGLVTCSATNEPVSDHQTEKSSSPEPVSDHKTAQVSGLVATPNLTKPNLTKPIDSLRSDDFGPFWDLYPKRKGRKVGKQAALKLFCKLPRDCLPDLLRAVTNYAGGCGEFPKDAERFLKNDFWRDWVDDAAPVRHHPAVANPDDVTLDMIS